MRVQLLCVIVWMGCDEQPADDTATPLDTDTPSVGDTDTDSPVDDGLAIAGSYTDEWDVDHTIDAASWVQVSAYGTLTFAILSFDNAGQWVIAQNGSANAYYPDHYSRFDWVEWTHGDIFYCQTTFDAATEAAAESTPRADDSDPENTGCGGFAWTNLTPS